MKAYVLVGVSKRLPGKHEIEVRGKRLVDIVVENLSSMGLDVVIYSKIPLEASVPVLEDKSTWILESVLSLFQLSSEFFLFGGDMPLVRREAVEMMLEHWDGERGLVPRWSSTGYLEPLHALYTSKMRPCLSGAKSLTGGISECPWVGFIEAEKMPEETFFNVNTREDLERLEKML